MSAVWMVCLYVPGALARQSGDGGSHRKGPARLHTRAARLHIISRKGGQAVTQHERRPRPGRGRPRASGERRRHGESARDRLCRAETGARRAGARGDDAGLDHQRGHDPSSSGAWRCGASRPGAPRRSRRWRPSIAAATSRTRTTWSSRGGFAVAGPARSQVRQRRFKGSSQVQCTLVGETGLVARLRAASAPKTARRRRV
jgi:hypothetical protein